MKKTLMIPVILILLFGGCSNPNKIQNKEDRLFMQRTYGEFVNSLPPMELPLTINCGFDSFTMSKENRHTLRWFTPAGYELIGNIEAKQPFYLILCTPKDNLFYPYLFISTPEGMTIDQVPLYNEVCTENKELERKTTTYINKDLTITLTDSIRYNGLSDSLVVVQQDMALKRNGTIKKGKKKTIIQYDL